MFKNLFLICSSDCFLPLKNNEVVFLSLSFSFSLTILPNTPSPPSVKFTKVPFPKSCRPYKAMNSISFCFMNS